MIRRTAFKELSNHSRRGLLKKVFTKILVNLFSKNIKNSVELNYLKKAELTNYKIISESLTFSINQNSSEYIQFSQTFEPRFLITIEDATIDTKTGFVFLGNKEAGFRFLEFSSEWPKEAIGNTIMLPRTSEIDYIESASIGLPSINYFHLITHWLGRVVASATPLNPILQTPSSHSLSCEILELYNLPFIKSPSRWVKVRNLSLVNATKIGYLHPKDKENITKPTIKEQSKEIDIYISRKRSSRTLPEESRIEASMSKRGFEVIYSEDLDLHTQIKLFSKARTIVAPHGAGLVNAIFAQKKSKIIEIMPSYRFNRCYEWQSSICNQHYTRIMYDQHVSPHDLIKMINSKLDEYE